MNKISYPQMGSYGVPIYYLLTHILKNEIIRPRDISTHTLELGSKYSPDFVCTPFKYTLGTMIESLEDGADILIQLGGGCRYGYYHELQEQILKDLGYHFTMINLISGGNRISIKKLLKEYPLEVKKKQILKSIFVTKKMLIYMDKIDIYIRKNRCYEKEKGTFNKLREKMLREFLKCRGYFHLRKIYKKYLNLMKQVPRKKVDKKIKVGIIGELYTLMEPRANEQIEELLNSRGIELKRYTNVTYLLFQKKKSVKRYLKNFFIKYRMGADALDNIHHTKELCEEGYDGIIHMKSSFCTPEIGAMPIIESVAQEYNVPVLFFSMDMNSSETGFLTRIEAFCDMLEMRKS